MPTLIPTGHYYSLLSHPLFRAQKSRLFEGQPQPIQQQAYSLPMQPMQQQTWMPPQPMQPMPQQQTWMPPQPMQPIPQQLYSLPMQQHPQTWIPMQPMQQQQTWMPPQQMQPMPQQQTWMPPQPMQQMQPMQQQAYSWPPLQMPPQPMQLRTSWQPYRPTHQVQPMPMQQVEQKMIVQSIHQNPDGTSDYITLTKSKFDQILRENHFNEVPANCDLKYSLTQNNLGQMNYNFHVIQRPEIRIASFQESLMPSHFDTKSPPFIIPPGSPGPWATIAGGTPASELNKRKDTLFAIGSKNLFGISPLVANPRKIWARIVVRFFDWRFFATRNNAKNY